MRSFVIVCLALYAADAAVETSNSTGVLCPSECKCAFFSPTTCSRCEDETKWGPQCVTACDHEDSPTKKNCQGCDFQGNCRKCKPGWWSTQLTSAGLHCLNECSERCDEKKCNTAGDCRKCAPGYFGLPLCKGVCPTGCQGACDGITGACLKCQDGLWGEKCDQDCSEHCSGGICKMDGTCACNPGFTGDDFKCTEECGDGCKVNEQAQGEFNTLGACSLGTKKCDYGCIDGRWGSQCDKECPAKNCQGGKCNRKTGACDCAPGWFGDKCDQECSGCAGGKEANCDRQTGACAKCPAGFFYGPKKDCKGKCPENCSTNTCTDDKGFCFKCKDGFFGDKCDKTCPTNCSSESCDRETGDCTDGCQPSWWNNKCEDKCSTHCTSTQCDQSSGECHYACSTGYFGSLCLDPCFGDHCGDDGCDAQTGVCLKCAPGYWGVNCEKECSACVGADDENVGSIMAHAGVDVCDRQTGKCDSCPPKKTGDSCTEDCPENCNDDCAQDGTCQHCEAGFFGDRCQHKCGYCGGNGVCSKIDGVCESCPTGKWGEKCNEDCASCKSGICNKDNGNCDEGECKDRWFGSKCNFKCHDSCKTCRFDGDVEDGKGLVWDCESCRKTANLEVRKQWGGRPHQRCIDSSAPDS